MLFHGNQHSVSTSQQFIPNLIPELEFFNIKTDCMESGQLHIWLLQSGGVPLDIIKCSDRLPTS